MTEIRPNQVNIQAVSNKPTVQEKKPETTEKSISTGVKVGLGAAAVAASAVAGILIHNKVATQKAVKSILNELSRHINTNTRLGLDKTFDNNILQGHITEALKLPKKEKLQKLKEINSVLTHDRGLRVTLQNEKSASKLPQSVKEAVASKDQLKTYKAYIEYCDNLFHKSKTAGATVQESVHNVFGKNTTIKPHTYDISKEADRIATAQYTSGAGYCDVTVKSSNEIADSLNHKNMVSFYRELNLPKGTSHQISQGVGKDGKPFVQITFVDGMRDDAKNGIRLLSPNGELTPAQKDLLKLKDTDLLLPFDLAQLTKSPSQTNFDAILSLIQNTAQKIK